MVRSAESRFDGEAVVRTATLTEQGRFEIQMKDSRGKTHVVSLPLAVAVDLGYLICDVAQAAPYLVGGHRQSR